MATDYNKDAWRLVEKKVREEFTNILATAIATGGTISEAIDAAIAAHEAKAEGATFANSHVVSAAE